MFSTSIWTGMADGVMRNACSSAARMLPAAAMWFS